MKQRIEIESLSKKYTIPSVVTIPDTAGPHPVVVMCHGTGSNKDEAGNLYVELADSLEKQGIASVRFDFVGNGESREDYIGYTLTSAVDDVKSVVEYIKKQPSLSEEHMGCVGFSQGGSVMVLSVSEMEEFKCGVGWSAALTLIEMTNEDMRKTADTQGWAWLDFDFRDSVRLSKQWMDEASKMDLLPLLEKRGLPLLAIAGTLDTVVPCECSQKMVKATHNPQSELVLVEGDHIFCVFEHDRVWKPVVEKTTAWLKEML